MTAEHPWLSHDEQNRIRASFARIAADADGFASSFYQELFRIAPRTRSLFKGDMVEQRRKLMRMLSLLVANLDAPEEIEGPLRQLGERHRGYGVDVADFDPVGIALISTLGNHLGVDFSAHDMSAWLALYHHVSTAMQTPSATLCRCVA